MLEDDKDNLLRLLDHDEDELSALAAGLNDLVRVRRNGYVREVVRGHLDQAIEKVAEELLATHRRIMASPVR